MKEATTEASTVVSVLVSPVNDVIALCGVFVRL